MITRITQFLLVATLGVVLHGVVFAPAASAESDVTLVSSTSVELPATIVLSSSQPTIEEVYCFTGVVESYGQPAPGLPFQPCDPYFVKRTGPESDGRYYFLWELPVSQPGQVNFQVGFQTESQKTVSFTVTGNSLKYGDFGSCIRVMSTLHYTGMKALVAYYARMSTEVILRVEEKKKVARSDGRQHWTWAPWKSKRTQFKVGPGSNGPYGRREVQFRVPADILPPNEARKYEGYEGRQVRARYLVKKGGHVIKKGYVSRHLCQEIPFSPYVQP